MARIVNDLVFCFEVLFQFGDVVWVVHTLLKRILFVFEVFRGDDMELITSLEQACVAFKFSFFYCFLCL